MPLGRWPQSSSDMGQQVSNDRQKTPFRTLSAFLCRPTKKPHSASIIATRGCCILNQRWMKAQLIVCVCNSDRFIFYTHIVRDVELGMRDGTSIGCVIMSTLTTVNQSALTFGEKPTRAWGCFGKKKGFMIAGVSGDSQMACQPDARNTYRTITTSTSMPSSWLCQRQIIAASSFSVCLNVCHVTAVGICAWTLCRDSQTFTHLRVTEKEAFHYMTTRYYRVLVLR